MDEKQKAEQEAAAAAAKQAEEEVAKKAAEDEANSQDPLKVESERIKKEKEAKTELEKAIFTRNKINARIRELGGESDDTDPDPSNPDDSAPVTVGMLKKIEQEKAAKTALTLAHEQIQDEVERDLVLHHLENSIKPSGDPVVDLAKARAIVNESKNRKIAEEATRRSDPRRFGKGNGAPGKSEDNFDPTPEELVFMKKPFNLSKEKILEARRKVANLQK